MSPTSRVSLIAIVACTALASPAVAEGLSLPRYESESVDVTPFLSDRARAEAVNWFDPGDGRDDDYGFFANVVRFGAELDGQHWKIHLEGQEVQLVGLPADAGGLGPGAVYFANTRDRDQRELHLRQGFFEASALGDRLRVRLGRHIYNDGTEQAAQDPRLQWVKKIRISQRLLGGFDYTHVGRSFDGGVIRYDSGPFNATLMGGLPTAGGFNISANKNISDIYTLYGALTVTEPGWLPRGDLRVFYLYYDDGRDVNVTDNRPIGVRALDRADLQIHTVGANYIELFPAGPGDIDVLVWAVGQFGDWQSQDHLAYAYALEAGYRLRDTPWSPWLRLGYNVGSGDDDPADGDHETFFQVLPTARLYARTPFFNMMNNRDVFVQLILKPAQKLALRIDYHHLWASEGNDLVYAGGGATQAAPIFGYAGFSAGGNENVADFVDVSATYTFSENFKAEVYFGHAFGRTVIENAFSAGSDLSYAYFEGTASF